ncbi:DUF1330 domain-containing protein [Nocardia bovistercoris]|uniref:DUF1330 domain-containing protein n=1 Tax=Nocardia bovistercoris TaxID=2785916 RepID=A0A931N134_9NOCA|nr:DUF1330 domain-containing protein [Nocardia bovistercoris]
MSKAYIVVKELIKDPAGMAEYGKVAAKSMAKGVTVLAIDTKTEVLEGEWAATQTVVLEFESAEAAHGWYDSEEYQAAIPLRQAAADCTAILINGL